MPKVIFINAAEKKVEYKDIADVLGDTQALVGGYVQQVPYVSNLKRSTLWVDEEGLCKGYQHGFRMDGHRFVGNGVVSTLSKSDTKANIVEVTARIQF